MRKMIIAITMLVISASASAQQIAADKIIGNWECEDYKINFFKSGNAYSAKLLWSKNMFEADGKTAKRDRKNPDEKLRDRMIQGITHITGLKYRDGEYVDAKLYSVDDGNTYSLKAVLKSENNLETRGYRGVPLVGKTFKWTRVN